MQRGMRRLTHSLNENHKEPLETVQNGVEVVFVEMFFQLWQEFREDFVMVAEKAHQLGKADDVEAVHGVLPLGHEGVQRPERLLLVQIEQQHADN